MSTTKTSGLCRVVEHFVTVIGVSTGVTGLGMAVVGQILTALVLSGVTVAVIAVLFLIQE
jgi:hypothetical protein